MDVRKAFPVPFRKQICFSQVVQTIDRAVISLIITQNKKVIHKIELIKTEPSFWIYRQYLGEIQWISRDCLKVYDKNGKGYF